MFLRIWDFLSNEGFQPHGYCLLWRPDVFWTHVVSDLVIALSYFSIPIALYYIAVRRADLVYRWVLYMFAGFIVACGMTHLMGVWTMWVPDYSAEALIKVATAMISATTAVMLWPLMPKLLALPSTTMLEEKNTALENEVAERSTAENNLRELNERLEALVAERTASLERANSELTRSNAELQQFAYLASHDLREPLRTICSYCELLEQRYTDTLDDKGRKYLNYASNGARDMQSLIDDLLTYSSVGRDGFESAPVALDTVVDDVERRLSALINDEGAQITHDGLPTVNGDATMLAQLFQNLIGNAIKFHGDAPPEIHISAERGAYMSTVSVSDNGIGIAPEYRDQVFKMFQRLHTKQEYSGNGLGLALCRRIVENHGGDIWIASSDGPGTTIRFTLRNADDTGARPA